MQLLLIAFSAAFLSVSFRYYGFPWQKIIADIIANEFFEKIAVALAKKKLLSAVDIKAIKSECKIVPVAL